MQHTSTPIIEEGRSAQTRQRTAGCADLARIVGRLDLNDRLFTGSLFATAVNELAAQTGHEWCFDPATPPAPLLRALSKLAMQAPDAQSSSARVLLDAHHTSLRCA